MKRFSNIFSLKWIPIGMVSLLICQVQADPAVSDVAGFVEKDCPADADTLISVPFDREQIFVGELSVIGDPDEDGNRQVSVQGLDGLGIDALANDGVVRLLEGAESGKSISVSANTATELTVNFGSTSPSPGTLVSVARGWTLDTLFPPATQTTFAESTGRFLNGRSSELHMVQGSSSSGDVAAERVFFVESGEWVESTNGFASAGDSPVPVGSVLVVRHRNAATASTLELSGTALHGSFSSELVVPAGGNVAHAIGLASPGKVSLSALAFPAQVFAPSSGLVESKRRDILEIYEGTTTLNPQPSASYFRFQGNWRKVEAGNPLSNNELIPAASGIVIRTAGSNQARTIRWIQP